MAFRQVLFLRRCPGGQLEACFRHIKIVPLKVGFFCTFRTEFTYYLGNLKWDLPLYRRGRDLTRARPSENSGKTVKT